MTYTQHTRDQALILMMATLGTDAQPTPAMAARVRASRFMLLPCQECGELHAAASLDGSTGLCEKCYDLAGMENEHSDGHHADNPNPDCADCQVKDPCVICGKPVDLIGGEWDAGPTEEQINDWNIANDHQDRGEDEA